MFGFVSMMAGARGELSSCLYDVDGDDLLRPGKTPGVADMTLGVARLYHKQADYLS